MFSSCPNNPSPSRASTLTALFPHPTSYKHSSTRHLANTLASTRTHTKAPPRSTSYTTHDSQKFLVGSYYRSHPFLPITIKTIIQLSLTTEMHFILVSTNGTATTPLKKAFLHQGSHINATYTLNIAPHH
jgi:hypothetical protein